MTVHAPTDVRSITIPEEMGGCGKAHEAPEDFPDGTHFSVECDKCEPHIIGTRTGWSHTLHGVALTPDEIGEVDAREQQAKAQQNRTWGDPNLFAETIAKAFGGGAPGTAPAGPSLLQQIAALPADELAALRGMLNATSDPAPEPALAVTSGGEGEDDSKEAAAAPTLLSTPVDSPVEEPRRGPGRPRKNP